MADNTNDPIVIVSGARTPMGGFQGALSSLSSPALGAHSIRAALDATDLENDQIDEVIMGCVLPAGLGQAPARQAAIGAGVGLQATCTTVNKMCGSGMKAIMLGHDSILSGSNSVVVAGGMESMSNAPYLLPKARSGLRMGHAAVQDHMFLDGLEDAYQPGMLMGHFAEQTASHYQFTRAAQDDFAITSLQRAQAAISAGTFQSEIAPVKIAQRKSETLVVDDEQPPKADLERIPNLRPAFDKSGTVTAANASSISDGAAALLLMHESEARRRTH